MKKRIWIVILVIGLAVLGYAMESTEKTEVSGGTETILSEENSLAETIESEAPTVPVLESGESLPRSETTKAPMPVPTPAPAKPTPKASKYEKYLGLWKHEDYPGAYSILIYSVEGDKLGIEMEAIRGNYAQIASAGADNVPILEEGVAYFAFEDSFSNVGSAALELYEDSIYISYDMQQPYQGGWCVDAGAGGYVKVKELSELPAGIAAGKKPGHLLEYD